MSVESTTAVNSEISTLLGHHITAPDTLDTPHDYSPHTTRAQAGGFGTATAPQIEYRDSLYSSRPTVNPDNS